MSEEPIQRPKPAAVADDPREAVFWRVFLPGMFIVLLGFLNLVAAGFLALGGYWCSYQPADEVAREVRQRNPEQLQEMKKQGVTPEQLKERGTYGGYVGAGIALLLALLAFVGGASMMVQRGYFLHWLGVLAALVSPGGLCVFGLLIGLWGALVLLSPRVRQAYR